ncbi:DUF1196 domain-containing protein, partial [Vibrio cholerae]|nr:DUF1196 domain-containing protein [Vibrio cholerae]
KRHALTVPLEAFVICVLLMSLVQLQKIPFVSIKILEHNHCPILFYSWFFIKNNTLGLHQLIISPEVIRL